MLKTISFFALAMTPVFAFAQNAVDKFEAQTYTAKSGFKLPYRVLKPEKIEAGKNYPLVLFLHGMGERGDNNTAQIKNGVERFVEPEKRTKYPCFVIVPQCPVTEVWTFDAKDKNAPKPLNAAFAVVDAFIKDNPVDKDRIYVIGLSMGGNGTYNALEARPKFFAGAIPICGWGNPNAAKTYKNVPVWIFHGDADKTVSPKSSLDMEAALKAAGGKPKLTMFPGVAHDSWTPALKDGATWEWLFQQKK